MGGESFTKIISSGKKLLQLWLQKSRNKNVVVFDIDDTLCVTRQTEPVKKHHPECPVIEFTQKGGEDDYVFLPHLDILFEYIIQQHGTRIVFCSAGSKERNVSVIPDLLTLFWGKDKHEKLKSEGQFDIYSRDDLRAGHSIGGEGDCVKDLKIVIRDAESLLDAILVEDDTSYTAFDQKPFLYMTGLFGWDISQTHFPKNNVYYMLGIFKTYFEREEYKKLPLRVGIDQILPREKRNVLSKSHPFRLKMIDKGLKEVQKKVPHAVLYTLSTQERYECKYENRNQNGLEKFSKETNFESFVRNLRIGNVPLHVYYLAKYLFERSVVTNQPVDFYQEFIVNLIKSLKDRDDVRIEEGIEMYDMRIVPKIKQDEDWLDHLITLVSFEYAANEEELENSAKKAVEKAWGFQPGVDVEKPSGYQRLMKTVSVGISFSSKSFLAAYSDNFEDRKEIYLTDIYVS